MRELAEISRAETEPAPSAETIDFRQRLADAVAGAVAQFLECAGHRGRSSRGAMAQFRALGCAAAREGHTLDALQDALRLGARVAWRWLCETDPGLDRQELGRVGEAIFAHLDELATACAQGYAEASALAAGERQRRSRRLLAVILSDPPPSADVVAGLARSAGWVPPARVAVAALDERRPPDALAWLQSGGNAAEVAQRIHVHPQTVRYRLRQIEELFGDQLRDPTAGSSCTWRWASAR